MTAVNKNSLYSDIFKVMFYNVSGIVAGSVYGIYSFFPDITTDDFPGYPICVVSSANVASKPETQGSDYLTTSDARVTVGLHSKSMKTLDELSDRMLSGLTASSKSGVGTTASGLRQFNISDSPTTTNVLGNDRVHSKNFGVSYTVHY